MACDGCNQAMATASNPFGYPFPSTDFDPMGSYEPPVRMDASASKFIGREKDGSPIYVENMSASTLVGFEKDGTPVFVSMAEPTNPINIIGTAAFIAASAALGWLVAGAVVGYMKK